jgi:hypothetical protein
LLSSFFLLVAPISTPITPIHASNAYGRGWTTNAGLGIGGSHHRRHGEARRNREA